MSGPLMVDVTTLVAEAGRIAHGTTRVERGIVAGLIDIAPPGLAFCRFDHLRGKFVSVRVEAVAGALVNPARAEAGRRAPSRESISQLSVRAKRLERLVRDHIRRPIGRRLAVGWRRIEKPRLPKGATLLSVGEIRFDMQATAGIIARGDAGLVSTIFDVLPLPYAGRPGLSVAQNDTVAAFDLLFGISRRCLCISDATARDVAKYAQVRGLASPRCEVIRLADELRFDGARRPDKVTVEPGRFVLCVGSITSRKNQKLLVDIWKAFAQGGRPADCKLVLVGDVHADCHDLVRSAMTDPELSARVVVLDNADDQVLAWLYANCRFTVFPSFLEGYGLPVAESLAAGKACIASSSSAVPEAAQGQALLLAPQDAAGWTAAISRLIESDEELRDLERRIAAHYRRHSWRDTAAQILAILEHDDPAAAGPGG